MRKRRKLEHIHHSLAFFKPESKAGFDDIRFLPVELPEADLAHVSLQTDIFGHSWACPLYINAITGGPMETMPINRRLAALARDLNLAMAVGSQTIAIEDRSVRKSFEVVRKTNPDGFVIANISAHTSPQNASIAVDMIEANALQIHLNLPQEIAMPEGETDFCGCLENIQSICEAVSVPVIVKGVGFGITRETAVKVLDLGISGIDVGGRGGTNFIEIENARRSDRLRLPPDWGITTVEALLDIFSLSPSVPVFASGGVYQGSAIIKSLALGAAAAGLAGPLLWYCIYEPDNLYQWVSQLLKECRLLMALLGCTTVSDLRCRSLIISGPSSEYCQARGIDYKRYANRG